MEIERKLDELCELINAEPHSRDCLVLKSAMYSAGSTLRSVDRRVFAQDLAASLNRKGILSKERYDRFVDLSTRILDEFARGREERLAEFIE